MTVDNSTLAVSATKSGTGWTIDVTDCNLTTDLTVKDFLFTFDGGASFENNTDFTKLSATSIQYDGASIASSTVTVYRDTPVTRIQEVTYGDRMTSDLWEDEFNRVHRILAEVGITPQDSIIADLSVSSLLVGDLTEDRVLIAGASGEVEDDANLTYDGTDLSTNSLIVTDLTNNRVLIAGSSGAVEDDGNLTYDGSTLDAPAITSQETIDQSSDDTTVPTTAWIRNASADIAALHQGRLSNLNSRSVCFYPTNQSTQSTTLYFFPHEGRHIALYDTTDNEWKLHEMATAVSLSTSGGSINLPHDVFLYDDGGTLTLEIEPWTDKTERSVTLVRVDNEVVKNSDYSKKYLGIVYLNSSKKISTISGANNFAEMGILNHKNRIPGRVYSRLNSLESFGSSTGTVYEIPTVVRTVSEDFSAINLINPHPPHTIHGHLGVNVSSWGTDPTVYCTVKIYSDRSSDVVGLLADQQLMIEDSYERPSFNVSYNTETSGVDDFSIGASLIHANAPDFDANTTTWIMAEVLW